MIKPVSQQGLPGVGCNTKCFSVSVFFRKPRLQILVFKSRDINWLLFQYFLKLGITKAKSNPIVCFYR